MATTKKTSAKKASLGLKTFTLRDIKDGIQNGAYQHEKIEIIIDWDTLKDNAVQALVMESAFTVKIATIIVNFAEIQCNGAQEDFLEIVEFYEFIVTELLNNDAITMNVEESKVF